MEHVKKDNKEKIDKTHKPPQPKNIREQCINTCRQFCPDLFEEDDKTRWEKYGS